MSIIGSVIGHATQVVSPEVNPTPCPDERGLSHEPVHQTLSASGPTAQSVRDSSLQARGIIIVGGQPQSPNPLTNHVPSGGLHPAATGAPSSWKWADPLVWS